MDKLNQRLGEIENQWEITRAELRNTRDWRVEGHLRFRLIDLKRSYSHILSLIAQHQRTNDHRQTS